MKTCTRCKQEKPLDEFHVLRQAKDGRQYRCKVCDAEVAAQRWKDGKTRDQRLSPEKLRQVRNERMRKYRGAPEKRERERQTAKVRRLADPEKSKRAQRNTYLLHNYGITLEQYEAMHDEQGGRCGICGQVETIILRGGRVSSLAVDHCHNSNKVRGLLCANCNKGLGLLGDSVEGLERALAYLRG